MKRNIFINYRREDSQWMAGRLYDKLLDDFSKEQLFIDIDSIDPGEDFEKYIEEQVSKCDILLAIIGSSWLQSINARINETDYVRAEIAAALKNNIRVIPILLGNTRMPLANELPVDLKEIGKRNAYIINHPTFNSDVEVLVGNIKKNLKEAEAKQPKFQKILKSFKQLKKKRVIAICFLVLLLVAAYLFFSPKKRIPESSGFLNMMQITSDGTLLIVALTTGYGAFIEKNDNATIPFSDYTPIYITDSTEANIFYYLLRTNTTSLDFKFKKNKFYVNGHLKALYFDADSQIMDSLDSAEIKSLETITINTTAIDSSLFNNIAEILNTNNRISIVSDSNYCRKVIELMQRTKPEILVCRTSFNALGVLNLNEVKFAMISAGDTVSSSFYRNLVLPNLRALIAKKVETSKLLLRNGAESITCIVDTALTDLSVLRNRDNIKQLQILDDEENDYFINFTDLSGYKNLKSFGYYNRNHVPNVSSIFGMISLNLHDVNFSDINQLASNNPNLEQLSISFSTKMTSLNWVTQFSNLRSLSICNFRDSINIADVDVSAISKLNNLQSFAIESESDDGIDKNSNQYKKLRRACPDCSIYQWLIYPGLCLGPGWLLLFCPLLLILLVYKRYQQVKSGEL